MSDAGWAIGSEIVGYRLIRDFGRDVSGDVFLAANPADRQVVIRAMDPDLAADRSLLMEFYQQAKLGMAIEHPGLLKVFDFGQAEGRHFVISEYRGLPNLKYQLHSSFPDRRRFEEPEAIRIVSLLAKTLEDLNEHRSRPVVHRAVAPANVLLDAGGQPILSGLQWGSPIQQPFPYPAQGITVELFQYLAPEQICERFHADPLADVYSLGALLYTLLTGKIPFKGRDVRETLRKKRAHEFQSPETIVPELSRSVVEIIRECLRADPDRRPPSMKRLREFLDCGDRIVGGYRLKAYLGTGNTGAVYQAVSPRGQQVAIKLVSPKIAADEARLQRFYRGAKFSIQIPHPHLLEGLEVNEDGGQHFLATELVQGESLTWQIQKHGPLPEAQALRIGIQIASALQHIHQHNLVHRDVKPGNVLIQPNGIVKLTGLGLSESVESAGELHDVAAAGRALATCQSIPPERFTSAKEIDYRGDLYSLGVTMFVLLTGKLPFKPASNLEMLMDKATNRFPTARQVNPGVSDATSRLISWMMQADPDSRPLSADSFIRAAEECLNRLAAGSESKARVQTAEPPQEKLIIEDAANSKGNSITWKPRPRRGFRQQMALGLGVLFVAMLAGLLLVKAW